MNLTGGWRVKDFGVRCHRSLTDGYAEFFSHVNTGFYTFKQSMFQGQFIPIVIANPVYMSRLFTGFAINKELCRIGENL